MGIPQGPHLPPLPPDPFACGDRDEAASEFGVPRGYEARLARDGVPPDEGGPYRGLSPGQGVNAGKQHRRYDARRVAD